MIRWEIASFRDYIHESRKSVVLAVGETLRAPARSSNPVGEYSDGATFRIVQAASISCE